MIYFYSRISSITQSGARQHENFKKQYGYDSKNVFLDKIQGNIPFMQRPEAIKLFETVTSNNSELNTICIDSLDRIGRSLQDILNTIQIFTNNGINLQSLKEGFSTLLEDGKENPMAKLVVACMGSISELERLKIKERSSEGILIARALGKYSGRKIGTVQSDEKLLERHQAIQKKIIKGLTIREISQITGASSATIIKVKKVMKNRNLLK
ncbi:recombinase family protein [Flavobacterium sp. FlaQc-30]|uniref:recombinase family protein n=1 Tax=Flavobacterium sp. FlaQc-30 TaxID=3374179 RepID=UPI0037567DBC